MAEVSVSRRLAAILAADVAGYSRLMGLDEAGTMRSLVARRTIIDRLIAEYHGRIANTAGDSVLAEFPSVVDAMECAIATQMAIAIENQDVATDRVLQFRIGIHVGDVMVRDGDLFGDGVNIAARIENLAEPGEIWASDRAREHVGDRLGIAFADQGEKELKNIASPVRVFRVGLPGAAGGGAAPIPAPIALATPAISDRPAIAVLPFSNMSGDAEQEYFADGITEDLITDLSKISGLVVIARNSTFAYKGKAMNVPQIARELNARYVLEGSVRKAGSRVRITAQLIDGNDGAHRWAERYDRDLHDIFAVQDEVGQQIIAALKLNLTPDEQRRVAGRSTRNIDAYDLFLQGRQMIANGEAGAALNAMPLFERAVALDPNFAAAQAGIGFVHMLDFINNRGPDPKGALARAETFALKAIALDEDEPEAQLMIALVSAYRHDREKALAAARRAVALDPNFVRAYATLANMLNLDNQPEEAIKTIQQAMRLDPRYPDLYLHFLGQSHFLLGRYESAVAVFEERIKRNKRTDLSRIFLAACYGHVGRLDEARLMWNEAQRINPGYSVSGRRLLYPYRKPTEVDALLAGLKLAGITDNFPDAPDTPPEDG